MKNHSNAKNIFLFILDAVRKDHLGAYGYERNTTPYIDKFAKQATQYNWAFSPSSYTWSAVPSILTSKYPHKMLNSFRLPPAQEYKIIKQIKAQGYKTAFFT